jgi:transposase-like protein
VRAQYTQEFKMEAVRQVRAGARLRAENARLKMERDIAKKAAAYFAQDVLESTPGSVR